MQLLRIVLIAAFLVPSLSAQKPAPNGEREINERVQKLREGIVEGRQIRSHVRVTVRLKNGNRLKGVVKDGRLVERVEGLRFVQAEANEEGAGIRVWYFDNSNNYVFLPFVDISDYRVQAKLTTQQLAALEQQLTEDARRKQELEQLERSRQAGDGSGAPPEGTPGEGTPPTPGQEPKPPEPAPPDANNSGAGGKPPTEGKLTEEQAKLFQLLQEYPPQAGWNAQKRDEIKRRMVTVGAKPSAAELRFVEVFDDWQKAATLFGVKSEPPAEEPAGRRKRR
jgi:hypothetical protein